jgi:hypothetical protein
MRKITLSIIILVVSSAFVNQSFSDIINAVRSGNAVQVAQYFDNTIEITLPSKSHTLNKKQAETALNDFFSQNPVKDFKVIHQSEKAGSEYCIGNLITSNGVFRTTIFTKKKEGKELIQELRFEK